MTEKEVRNYIGEKYVNGQFDSEKKDFVKEAYRVIAKINAELFKKIPYQVIFTDYDTYSSAKDMRQSVEREKVIYIYKGDSEHEFLTEKENWIGRAVHDTFAHLVCGCPFTFVGEYNAYLEQRKHYPEWTWKILFAEIPAQTSAYYYIGGFNFKQRAIEAPVEWLEMCEQFKHDFSHNSILKPMYCN